MPVPKLPKVEIPWFKQYALIIGVITTGILVLTIYFGYMAKDELLYPRLSTVQLVDNLNKYKNMQIGLQGQYLNFSAIQKPLCVPQGGSVQYPSLRSEYKTLPVSWGVSYNGINVGVKVVTADGQELDVLPKYPNGQNLDLKGMVRLTTTLDSCNLAVAYQSAYLEVRPDQIGLEQQ